jgi:peptidoglycan/LPS O-acetylase OafA/YrhL
VGSVALHWLIAALFAIHVVGFAAISENFSPWFNRYASYIRWIAGATFSIYLAHLPVMHLLAAISPWQKSSPMTLILLLIVTPLACLAFAQVSERQKESWRRVFASMISLVELHVGDRAKNLMQRLMIR